MKKQLFILLFVLSAALNCFSQINISNRTNEAFTFGEKLKYRVYYHSLLTGKLTAGIATMEIADKSVKVAGKNTYHIEAIGKSKGVFNWFYTVHDRFATWVEVDSLIPLSFLRRTNEGDYKVEDDVVFDHTNLIATSRQEAKKIPKYTQDIISAFYYARTLDFTNLKDGQTFPLVFYLDDSVYTSIIKYTGKETIKIEHGEFRCLKFKPMVIVGEAFDDPYPMTIWISDDKNKVPLLIESEVIIGSVKLELLKYSGLRNPMTSKVK
jgi:hypothetical protein